MNMVEIKVSDLSGEALNFAVAVAIRLQDPRPMQMDRNGYSFAVTYGEDRSQLIFKPSTDWGQGGPLLDEYKVVICYHNGPDQTPLATTSETHPAFESGVTILVAACRAIVAAKLGDTVSVPRFFI